MVKVKRIYFEVTEDEHVLLSQYAKKQGKPLKQVVFEAVMKEAAHDLSKSLESLTSKLKFNNQ